MVEVLLLHRHMSTDDVITGITAALRVGSASPDVVAVEARKNAHPGEPTPIGLILPRVVDLQARRAAAGSVAAESPVELPADRRPWPSVVPYDDLLTRAGS